MTDDFDRGRAGERIADKTAARRINTGDDAGNHAGGHAPKANNPQPDGTADSSIQAINRRRRPQFLGDVAPVFRRIRILCVEPRMTERELLHNYCDVLNWQIDFAFDAMDGLTLAFGQTFDIILANRRVSVMSVFDMVHMIREAQGRNATTSIALMDASSDLDEDPRCRELGISRLDPENLLLSSFKSQITTLI